MRHDGGQSDGGHSDGGRPTAAITPFDFGDFRGAVTTVDRPLDLETTVRALTDPATGVGTVHWGRNYLYRAEIETATGPQLVIVKQFRNQGVKARLRRRLGGSKALRSWRAALAFEAAGVATAAPVAVIESALDDGPAFFVSREIKGALEARYLLRARIAGTSAEDFPQVDFDDFIARLGALLRRMHDHRLFHRDLSIGNVLLPGAKSGAWPTPGQQALAIIDLNRVRVRQRRLTTSERTRDLCRLTVFRREDQDRLLEAYWGRGRGSGLRRLLYVAYHHGFRTKIASKKALRRITGAPRAWLTPRRAHAHIPAAQPDAGARDKIVWDELSDQPHQHAGKLEKVAVRLRDLPSHVRFVAAALAATPRIAARYRALGRRPVEGVRPAAGMGVCVRPFPTDPAALLEAIDDLGVPNVLLRLHPWQAEHDDELALARELSSRGYDLAFSLPQNRDLVRDPSRWRASIAELAERFVPYGRHFQVGQAVNRSKWGIWRYSEYLDLAGDAAEILRRHPGVEIFGPAVIDFELHATAAILNHPRAHRIGFDGLASLLYVDRRGAPENSQLGFDTTAKVKLCRAIAETAPGCGARCWITEVNWPLWEGPHSPAGRSVAVGEETQADYLARFYVLALVTGLVERVYWWQLVARGYGLAEPSSAGHLRRRPSFAALATLERELSGLDYRGREELRDDVHLYRFRRRGGGDVAVGWSTSGPQEIRVGEGVERVVSQAGEALDLPRSGAIVLMPSVQYLHLRSLDSNSSEFG